MNYSVEGDYALPWRVISNILSTAWRDARHCTCIYPSELTTLKNQINKIGVLRDQPLAQIQVLERLKEQLEIVRDHNQLCPQHAMYYRYIGEDGKQQDLIPPPSWCGLFHNKGDRLIWRLSLLSISKRVYYHLSKYLQFYLSNNKTTTWDHLSSKFNPIKSPEILYIESVEDYPIERKEAVTLLSSVKSLSIGKPVTRYTDKIESHVPTDLKSIHLQYLTSVPVLQSIFLHFNQLTSISVFHVDSNIIRAGEIEKILPSLTFPIKKLVFSYFLSPSLLTLPKVAKDSLEVARLIESDYPLAFPDSGPPLFPNLRLLYTQTYGHKKIRSPTLQSLAIYPEFFIPEILENNPNIETLKFYSCNKLLEMKYLDSFKQIRKLVLWDKPIVEIVTDTLGKYGFVYCGSKNRFKKSKSIFLKLGNQLETTINEISTRHNNNINYNSNSHSSTDSNTNVSAPSTNNNNNKIQHQLLSDDIIHKIIKYLWKSIDRCTCFLDSNSYTPFEIVNRNLTNKALLMKQECPIHCWFDNNTYYQPGYLAQITIPTIYKIRQSSLSLISKNINLYIKYSLKRSVEIGILAPGMMCCMQPSNYDEIIGSDMKKLNEHFPNFNKAHLSSSYVKHLDKPNLKKLKINYLDFKPNESLKGIKADSVSSILYLSSITKINLINLYEFTLGKAKQLISSIQSPVETLVVPHMEVSFLRLLALLPAHAKISLKKVSFNIYDHPEQDLINFPNVNHLVSVIHRSSDVKIVQLPPKVTKLTVHSQKDVTQQMILNNKHLSIFKQYSTVAVSHCQATNIPFNIGNLLSIPHLTKTTIIIMPGRGLVIFPLDEFVPFQDTFKLSTLSTKRYCSVFHFERISNTPGLEVD